MVSVPSRWPIAMTSLLNPVDTKAYYFILSNQSDALHSICYDRAPTDHINHGPRV
jgi:hypothetical protein